MSTRKACVAAILALTLGWAGDSVAQPGPASPPAVPTTRILAVGTVTPGADIRALMATLPSEVRATVELYLAGKIDQWYSLQDRKGVAFILNVTDPTAARAMLEALPLGQAHLMTFELIPLGPLNPLRQLQGMAGAPR